MSRFHGMRNEAVIEILVKEEVEKMNIVSGKDLIISNLLIKVAELDRRIEKLEEGNVKPFSLYEPFEITCSSDKRTNMGQTQYYTFDAKTTTFTKVR